MKKNDPSVHNHPDPDDAAGDEPSFSLSSDDPVTQQPLIPPGVQPEPKPASAPRPPVAREKPPAPAGPGQGETSAWMLMAASAVAAGILVFAVMQLFGPGRQLAKSRAKWAAESKTLQTDLETARIELDNLKLGQKNLSELLNAFKDDWDKPPDRPRYMKAGTGVIIYWEDRVIWRRYLLYQGRGSRGAASRFTSRPQKQSFVFIANPQPGQMRFFLTSFNKEGKETKPGEPLMLNFPLD